MFMFHLEVIFFFYKPIFDVMHNSQGIVICRGGFRVDPTLDQSGATIQNVLIRQVKLLIGELSTFVGNYNVLIKATQTAPPIFSLF